MKSYIKATQGTSNLFVSLDENSTFHDQLNFLKNKIRELFNLKNICFLFGSGTSAGAIPTMQQLYENLNLTYDKELDEIFKTIVSKEGENLESILRVLYSARTFYEGTEKDTEKNESCVLPDIKNEQGEKGDKKRTQLELYNDLISAVEQHIFNEINVDVESKKEVLDLYKTFYQKLALRNKDLSRLNIFTTNNDLFNETAMDALNIHYINGFSGGLRKFFNPALFNYTWSKRMDVSIDKYEPVENMVYLYKIHGSVNWRESEQSGNNYFDIEEVCPQNVASEGASLIYPTPTKQDKSLGAPYVDLFREFQNKLLLSNTVLFIIGYGFNDNHVNNIIYRALATNSTINVVIFGEKPSSVFRNEKPIFFVNDNRIYTISGNFFKDEPDSDKSLVSNGEQNNDSKGISYSQKPQKIHYFDYIVNELLPNLDAFKNEENFMQDILKELKQLNKK